MRYNLLITDNKNNQIAFDTWYDNLQEAKEMFDNLSSGVCVGYTIEIVYNNNGSCDLVKEYTPKFYR